MGVGFFTWSGESGDDAAETAAPWQAGGLGGPTFPGTRIVGGEQRAGPGPARPDDLFGCGLREGVPGAGTYSLPAPGGAGPAWSLAHYRCGAACVCVRMLDGVLAVRIWTRPDVTRRDRRRLPWALGALAAGRPEARVAGGRDAAESGAD